MENSTFTDDGKVGEENSDKEKWKRPKEENKKIKRRKKDGYNTAERTGWKGGH